MKRKNKKKPDYRNIARNLYNQKYNKPSYDTGEIVQQNFDVDEMTDYSTYRGNIGKGDPCFGLSDEECRLLMEQNTQQIKDIASNVPVVGQFAALGEGIESAAYSVDEEFGEHIEAGVTNPAEAAYKNFKEGESGKAWANVAGLGLFTGRGGTHVPGRMRSYDEGAGIPQHTHPHVLTPQEPQQMMQGPRSQSLYDKYRSAGVQIPVGYTDSPDEQIRMLYGPKYEQIISGQQGSTQNIVTPPPTPPTLESLMGMPTDTTTTMYPELGSMRRGTRVRSMYNKGDKVMPYDPTKTGFSEEDMQKHIEQGTAITTRGELINLSDLGIANWQQMPTDELKALITNIRIGAGGPKPTQPQFDMMSPEEKELWQTRYGDYKIHEDQPTREEMMMMQGGPSYAYGDRLETAQRQAKQQMYYGPRAPKIPDNLYSGMYGTKVPGYRAGDVVGKAVGVNKDIDPSLEGLHPDELTLINRERGEIVERQLPGLNQGDPGNYFVYGGKLHSDTRSGMPNGGDNEIEQIGAFITPRKYSDKMKNIVINRKENQDILEQFA